MKLISTLLIKFAKFANINNNTNDVTNVFNDHNNFIEIINTKISNVTQNPVFNNYNNNISYKKYIHFITCVMEHYLINFLFCNVHYNVVCRLVLHIRLQLYLYDLHSFL